MNDNSKMLAVRNARLHFSGIKALDGCEIEVDSREIHGVIGPNGSGKSTLFNVISGLYRLESGIIKWEGQPTTELSAHQIANLGISRTFQTPRVFSDLSVEDNLKVPRCLSRWKRDSHDSGQWSESIEELIELVFGCVVPNGRAGTLSYGAKRKLELARAFSADPRLVLLDEPTAGLNETESIELAAIVQRVAIAKKTAVLVIEHDISFVRTLCKKLSVLNLGRRIETGDTDAVLSRQSVVEAYVGV